MGLFRLRSFNPIQPMDSVRFTPTVWVRICFCGSAQSGGNKGRADPISYISPQSLRMSPATENQYSRDIQPFERLVLEHDAGQERSRPLNGTIVCTLHGIATGLKDICRFDTLRTNIAPRGPTKSSDTGMVYIRQWHFSSATRSRLVS